MATPTIFKTLQFTKDSSKDIKKISYRLTHAIKILIKLA